MSELVELWDKPAADEKYLIAGWRQWADAGAISSGLPEYLIEQTEAQQVGEIKENGYYLFQIPGTHHFLRPEIKFEEGYRVEMRKRRNEFYYAGSGVDGLFLFMGDEPHLNEERYAQAFLDAVEELGVKRVAAVGGVYGSMPYDKDRQVSCTYSIKSMKEELDKYALRYSNYEGGATIGSYFVDQAANRGIEFLVFNAFVPAYDFNPNANVPQGISIENDFRAWYDLMRRFNYMFNLRIDLSDLDRRSEALTSSMDEKISEMERKMPQLKVREYMAEVASDFTENPFMPLDDMWERELGDLFDTMEDPE